MCNQAIVIVEKSMEFCMANDKKKKKERGKRLIRATASCNLKLKCAEIALFACNINAATLICQL